MIPNAQDELLDRARLVIRELREKLSAAEARSQSAPIAVIGMGLRFPGCGSDPEQFWRMIAEGRDAVTEIPSERWNGDALYDPGDAVPGKINTRYAAFLSDVKRFDAAFFDITPREATRMDPQQRIFLETAWHAIEDAGLTRGRIAGSDAGIFVGVHNHSADYQAMQFDHPEDLDAYSATGTAHDMIAGRLAYWLDLHGPALAVNTACSSSLTAVHLACRSLRAGDCGVAIAGGVNLLLSPGSSVAAAQLQLLSPDGRCKPFDARADGMGRGEGCGVLVLKKLAAAERDGDRVLGLIRGSAVNQDGRTNGLTAPNGLAQQRVVRRALEDAGVDPAEIGFVETHGTGTSLGDPIEVEALAEVLGGGRRSAPCVLGAVKANIGHLEGAAGIAGLIKTLLVLRHRWLPPVARLKDLNPHLAFDRRDLEIPKEGRAWKSSTKRLAGVSSFGFSGTNAHVVLEEATVVSAKAVACRAWPVLVSAHSVDALRALAASFADRLAQAEDAELAGISYTSAVRRTHHAHRIAVLGTDAKDIASQLRLRVADLASDGKNRGDRNFASSLTIGSDELSTLARAWEAGAEVDWGACFASPAGVVDLPRYPFHGREYWLDAPPASVAPGKEVPVARDWLYATHWFEEPLVQQAVPTGEPPRTWLLFNAESSFGSLLTDAIQKRGDKIIPLPEALNSADQICSFLAKLAWDGKKPDFAVYLPQGDHSAEMIARALEATQAILRNGWSLKLWFITLQVEQVIPLEMAPHPAQCAMRGFSRVFGLEYPEFAGGLIDIDIFSQESATAVCDEILDSNGEDRVALRQGRRWVARLQHDSFATEGQAVSLRQDRCYLVTGAFGRLGMQIASWLVDRGALHLALIGRRSPQEMASPQLLASLERWRSQGLTIVAEACDVSDAAQIKNLLAKVNETGAPIGGVIHAAAGIRFSPLEDATREDVDVSFQAKFTGAHVLDHATRQEPLEFFVLFSSAAATLGLRNGALYAAANASLDAVVRERQSLGLPVLSVEWGSWKSAGEDDQQELVEQSGFVPMPAERALRVLDALIASHRERALVSAIDWKVLYPALELRGRHRLAAEVGGESTEGVAAVPQAQEISPATEWLGLLRKLPSTERRNRMLDFVGGEVRQVFGMMPGDPIDEARGLFEQGMDSLMSVRLKRRLESGTGLRLPGTVTLSCPSIAALADYLDGKLFPAVDTAAVKPHESQDSILSASVAEMSDLETKEAIAAELAALQQKLGVE
jgi:acyl transferase domain-containing protein